MRKLWTLALTPLLSLAFLMVGSGPANAFGSEVLGCSVNAATWTAGSCQGGGVGYDGATVSITYSLHNLSGSYSYRWSIYVDGNLNSNYTSACTNAASCTIQVKDNAYDYFYRADVVVTQSGRSETLSAQAKILGWWINDPCRTC